MSNMDKRWPENALAVACISVGEWLTKHGPWHRAPLGVQVGNDYGGGLGGIRTEVQVWEEDYTRLVPDRSGSGRMGPTALHLSTVIDGVTILTIVPVPLVAASPLDVVDDPTMADCYPHGPVQP